MLVEKNPTTGRTVDLLGFAIEFLTPLDDDDQDFAAMRGRIPAGGYIPLHAHDETESFLLESGSLQVLRIDADDNHQWVTAQPGDYVHIPNNVPHALHNPGITDAVQLIGGTPRLARFLRDAATPEDAPVDWSFADGAARMQQTAERYGYWLASPAENQRYGITL